MPKNWRRVKKEIEAEIDRIWSKEPVEVALSKHGIFPSGAGVGNQVLGNLYFQLSDTQGMGWGVAEPAMKQALVDETFSVEHCKKMWKYMIAHRAKLLGASDPPYCPAPWLNLPKVYQFYEDIAQALDSVKTKDQLADLVWSWFAYINCLNRWFSLAFPWHLGRLFPLVREKDVHELNRLSRITFDTSVNRRYKKKEKERG